MIIFGGFSVTKWHQPILFSQWSAFFWAVRRDWPTINHHFLWGKASPWWFSIWWKSQCFINFAGLVSSPMFDGLYDVSFPCLTWNHMIFHQASNGHPSVRPIKRRTASRCAKKTNGKEAATQSLGLSGFQDSMGIFDGNIIGIQLGISWKYRVNSWWDKVGFQLSMECWVV